MYKLFLMISLYIFVCVCVCVFGRFFFSIFDCSINFQTEEKTDQSIVGHLLVSPTRTTKRKPENKLNLILKLDSSFSYLIIVSFFYVFIYSQFSFCSTINSIQESQRYSNRAQCHYNHKILLEYIYSLTIVRRFHLDRDFLSRVRK